MDAAWIGVIGTIVGGTLVGVVAITSKIIELRYQRTREDQILRRQRLEELHLALSEFRGVCTTSSAQIGMKLISADASNEEKQTTVNDMVFAIHEQVARLDSLHSLWATDILSHWHGTLTRFQELANTATEAAADSSKIPAFHNAFERLHDQLAINQNILAMVILSPQTRTTTEKEVRLDETA